VIARIRASIAPFFEYLRLFPGLASAILLVGALSSLAEGVGLSLFIPLLSGLSDQPPTGAGTFVRTLNAVFASVPREQRLPFIAGCLLTLLVLRSALLYGTQALFAVLDARIGQYLRSRIFKQSLDVNYAHWERAGTETLFNALTSETWRVGSGLATLLTFAIALSTLTVYATVLLLISWPLTLLCMVALLAFSGLARVLTRRLVALGRLATHANAFMTKRVLQAFDGMSVIRAFAREDYEQRRFDKASNRVRRVFLRMNLLQALIGPLLELCAGLLVVGLLVYFASFSRNLPGLLVFLLVLYRLQPKVREANESLISLDTLQGAVAAVNSELRRDDKSYMLSGDVHCAGIRDQIRFDRVSFNYPGAQQPALSDFSALLPFARTTALVGPSGSGKSTLVKLLIRLYDPTSGEVSFDGAPLSSFEIGSLRERVAIVSQNVHLFDTSIRRNIAYGRPGTSLEAIIEAAKKADAHDFISALPNAYETRVGNRGVRLSGGQQQRITLARAIVAKPDLLILDEATNALDSMSEEVVQRALQALRGTCAIVVVAHRLATIEQADNILVLEAGRLREQGSFHELIQRGGLFSRLYELQFRNPAPVRLASGDRMA
jgi:ATP-binding cassette, subfamily B, bacterial MsbA